MERELSESVRWACMNKLSDGLQLRSSAQPSTVHITKADGGISTRAMKAIQTSPVTIETRNSILIP
jgi:hypothetical protein